MGNGRAPARTITTGPGRVRRRAWVLAAALSFSVMPAWAGEVLDKVIAVVNDEIITQSELDRLLIPIYEKYRKTYSGDELVVRLNQARQGLLSQLIEDKLVYQEAKRLGVKVSEEEVNSRFEEFKTRFASAAEFENLLKEQGLTATKLKERYRQQIAIRKLQQYEVQTKVIVTPKDIEDYYRRHLGKFTREESARVRAITLKKGEEAAKATSADPAVRARAEEILSRLYRGEDFGELAKIYSQDTKASQGGDLGWVRRGDLVNAIDQVLFNLKEGEISPILETATSHHIFKIEEKKTRHTKSLGEVREDISDHLFQSKTRRRFKEWVRELKKSAYISIR